MATLLYQGHASFRLITMSGIVIYIDPFIGEGYDEKADFILVTHQHTDHNHIELPAKKKDCIIWQNFEALTGGVYQTLRLKEVYIAAVPAYNQNHKKSECVGYIIEVDGVKMYFAGDTSNIPEMEKLQHRNIDYAFLPIDGIYNMGPAEAAKCAEIIKAKHSIPYHMIPCEKFSMEKAMSFKAKNRMIMEAGKEYNL